MKDFGHRIKRGILKADVLAPEIKLKIEGNTSYRTFFGALLSVGYIATQIFFIQQSFLKFWNKKAPTVTQTNIDLSEAPTIHLSDFKYLPIVYLKTWYNKQLTFEEQKKYGTWRSWRASTQDDPADILYEEMPVRPCSVLIDEGRFDKFFQYHYSDAELQRIREFGACVDPEERELKLVNELNGAHAFWNEIEFFPCSLDTGCEPAEVVRSHVITFENPLKKFNIKDYDNPVDQSVKTSLYISINERMQWMVPFRLTQTEVIDERGLFFDDKIKFNGSVVSKTNTLGLTQVVRDEKKTQCTAEEIDGYTTCLPYLTTQITSSTESLVITRSYTGILDMFGEMGGIKQILDVIFLSLYTFIHSYLFRRHLLYKIFNLRTHRNIFCCKKNNTTDPITYPSALSNQQSNPYSTEDKLKQRIQSAHKIIDENLDIVTILKELNILQVLAAEIFKNYVNYDVIQQDRLKRGALNTNDHSGVKHLQIIPAVSEYTKTFTIRNGSGEKGKGLNILGKGKGAPSFGSTRKSIFSNNTKAELNGFMKVDSVERSTPGDGSNNYNKEAGTPHTVPSPGAFNSEHAKSFGINRPGSPSRNDGGGHPQRVQRHSIRLLNDVNRNEMLIPNTSSSTRFNSTNRKLQKEGIPHVIRI